MVSENLSTEESFLSRINGISVSPKKSFSILKIWMSDCDFTDENMFHLKSNELSNTKVLFKPHHT